MSAWFVFAVALGLGSAHAQPDDPGVAYPMQATVRLDGCGACTQGAVSLRVPAGLRSVDDPVDGSDLLLLDREGRPVPFAVARGEGQTKTLPLRTTRSSKPDTYQVAAPDRAIDGVQILPTSRAIVGWMTVRDARTRGILAGPTLIWTHEVGEQRQVHFSPTTAPLEVSVVWLGLSPTSLPRFQGLQRVPARVAPDRISAPVVSQRVTEDGTVDYTVQLDAPLPVRAIDLGSADGAVIDRQVRVHDAPLRAQAPGPFLGAGNVRRVRVGEATLDAMMVRLDQAPTSDRFAVQISSEGQPVLELASIDVLLEGETLWFQPQGPGPYTLLGGAPPQTRPPSELQVALSELVRMPRGAAVAEDIGPNPDFAPPVLRSGLADPGRLLPRSDAFAYTAAVTGTPGMVRIPLAPAVQMASARALQDLRLTDPTGRQIPHLIRRTHVDPVQAHAIDALVRTEEDGVSRIEVPVEHPGVSVATVVLHTDAAAFRREVRILRPAADELVALRVVSWNGADRPGALGVAVEATVGDVLVVEIDNGDDPPLPIRSVEVARPGWEMVAVVPDGVATLHVGDPRREAADFDIQLYEDDLIHRARTVATVGPLVEQEAAPLAFIDRAALWAGLVVLVVGLAGLTIRLIRSVPPVEPPSDGPDHREAVAQRTDEARDTKAGEVPRAG